VLGLLINYGADIQQAMHLNRDIEYTVARKYCDEQPSWHSESHRPGHDFKHAIYSDKWNQAAIQAVWRRTCKTNAIARLIYSLTFLVFLLGWGLHESVGSLYLTDQVNLYASQQTVANYLIGEEFNQQETKSFVDIGDFEEMWAWVDTIWMPTLYAPTQYYRKACAPPCQQDPVTPVNDRLAGMFQFVGRPQIRQLRKEPTGCMQKASKSPDGVCYDALDSGSLISDSNADELPYGPDDQWQFVDSRYADSMYPSYMVSSEFTSRFPIGHRVIMPRNNTDAQDLIISLKKNNFIDLNTRAVIFEVVATSGSSDFCVFIRLIVTSNSNGGFLARPYVKTLRVGSRVDFDGGGVDLDAFGVVWISFCYFFIFLYFRDEFLRMIECWTPDVPEEELPRLTSFFPNPPKWLEPFFICREMVILPYWLDVFNYFDVFSMILFICLTALYIAQIVMCNTSIDWYAAEEDQPVADIFYLATIQSYKLFLLGGILWIQWFKILEYCQINANLAMMVRVTFLMLARLGMFIFILVVFVLGFTSFYYVLEGVQDERYSTFMNAFFAEFDGSVGNHEYIEDPYAYDKTLDTIAFIVFALLMVLLLLNLLIALMTDAYEDVKKMASQNWAYMQLQQIVLLAEREMASEEECCHGFDFFRFSWWVNHAKALCHKGPTLKEKARFVEDSAEDEAKYHKFIMVAETHKRQIEDERDEFEEEQGVFEHGTLHEDQNRSLQSYLPSVPQPSVECAGLEPGQRSKCVL